MGNLSIKIKHAVNETLRYVLGDTILNALLYAFGGKEAKSLTHIKAANALVSEAYQLSGEEAAQLYYQASAKYRAALDVNPASHEVLYVWGYALTEQAKRTKDVLEAEGLWRQAADKYQQSLQIEPNNPEALNKWGNALVEQAKSKQGKAAIELWIQAAEKYRQVVALAPDYHMAVANLSNILAQIASSPETTNPLPVWLETIENYQKALLLEPNDSTSLYNLGIALREIARRDDGSKNYELLQQSAEKFRQALRLKPDLYEAALNLGYVLAAQTNTAQIADTKTLCIEANNAFQIASALRPHCFEAWDRWGYSLNNLARLNQGELQREFFAETYEKWGRAEAITPGSSTYNLACIATLLGHTEEAQRWLKKCVENGTLPPRPEIEADPDLENLRELPWFQEILSKAPESA